MTGTLHRSGHRYSVPQAPWKFPAATAAPDVVDEGHTDHLRFDKLIATQCFPPPTIDFSTGKLLYLWLGLFGDSQSLTVQSVFIGSEYSVMATLLFCF